MEHRGDLRALCRRGGVRQRRASQKSITACTTVVYAYQARLHLRGSPNLRNNPVGRARGWGCWGLSTIVAATSLRCQESRPPGVDSKAILVTFRRGGGSRVSGRRFSIWGWEKYATWRN